MHIAALADQDVTDVRAIAYVLDRLDPHLAADPYLEETDDDHHARLTVLGEVIDDLLTEYRTTNPDDTHTVVATYARDTAAVTAHTPAAVSRINVPTPGSYRYPHTIAS